MSFSLINILGLAVGLAGGLLILQYTFFELSYNKFHEKSTDIYRISYSKEKNGVESFNTVLTYAGVGRAMKENFPEVLEFARLRPASLITSTAAILFGDKVFEEKRVFYADPSYLEMFSFKILEGDKSTALNEQFSAMISASTAKKYFGDNDPIGGQFKIAQRPESYTVTGIFEDVPPNSHVKFDFLLSHSTLSAIMPAYWNDNIMGTFHAHLYVLLQPDADVDRLTAKFPKFVDDFIWSQISKAEDTELKLNIMALEDIHLYSNIEHEAELNGDAKVVTYLSIIAILILVIAWVNYINLSTARSAERAREVGVRKVLGSLKVDLIRQFLFESAVVNFIAIVTAAILFLAAQSLFRTLGADEMLTLKPWENSLFWMAITGLFVVGVLFSGFYPAFALSSYRPIQVLRGSFYGNKKGILLRKVLVIFQFTASISLLIGTSIVFQQIRHMRNQDLGIEIDQQLVVKAPLLADSTYSSKFQGFKTELSRHASVVSVTASGDVPGREFNSATWFKKVGDSDNAAVFCYSTLVDNDFLNSMGIELIAGRQFESEDNAFAIMMNEAAVREHGFESAEAAIGEKFTFMGTDGRVQLNVVGVVKNYHHLSPKLAHSPLFIRFVPQIRKYYIVKFNTGDDPAEAAREMVERAEQTYHTMFGENPFDYFFLDNEFERQFESDQQFGDVFGIFSLLAILVASLGLFGLSSYTVLQKTKEIGIRKVLGSSIGKILRLLSWEFAKLILLSNLIAWPLIYYLMNRWLETFASRITIAWWLFPAACILVAIIAMITVSFHTVRAANANPVNSLRHE